VVEWTAVVKNSRSPKEEVLEICIASNYCDTGLRRLDGKDSE
jgi:hypothetical protein